jgi:hypothetical protein
MNYSKETLKFISSLVREYAKFEKLDNAYDINLNSIPESELEEFSSLLMQHDNVLASEATGLDNPNYEKSMLPALTNFLKNPNKDNEIEYMQTWREGIADYFKNTFYSLIENALREYNTEVRKWAA